MGLSRTRGEMTWIKRGTQVVFGSGTWWLFAGVLVVEFDVDRGFDEEGKEEAAHGPDPCGDGDLDPGGDVLDDLSEGRGHKSGDDEAHAFLQPDREEE